MEDAGMRIVFVGNGLVATDQYPTPGVGGSVQTWGVAKELAKRGHEVTIIRRSNIADIQVEKIQLLGVNFRGLDDWFPPYSIGYHSGAIISGLKFSKSCLKIITEIKPDILFLIDRASGFFPSRLRLPKIYIMHTPETLDFYRPYAVKGNILNSIVIPLKKVLEDKVLKAADRIVTLNSSIRKHLEFRGFDYTVQIPNGIDPNEFSDRGDHTFILFAGRFDWNKDVASLVGTFSRTLETYPDSKLCLVGDGPEKSRLCNLIKKKRLGNSVEMRPWLPRTMLANMLGECSFFVLPSLFEVFPVVVLEAMASSKPVIAKANMGSTEVIEHGENGFLYKNKRELQKYLELFLSNPKLIQSMGKNARRTVEERFTFKRIADRYDELQQSLAGG